MKITEVNGPGRDEKQFERINSDLCKVLYEKYRADWDRVFGQEHCDIDPSFLGFVDLYYYLSQIIPKHFMVVDFGCAYAPQGYFFRDHKGYVGVDNVQERFMFGNTEHKIVWIEDELENWKHRNLNEVFAICSYVPANTDKLRMVFKNLFVYYPCGGYDFKKKVLDKLKVREAVGENNRS